MRELSAKNREELLAYREQLLTAQRAEEASAEAERFRTGSLPLAIDPALRTAPMGHQVRAMNFCATLYRAGERGVALLMEQGTGKSLVAIGLVTAMAKKGAARWALVICPNSLKGTWAASDGEILKHSALPAEITVLRGSKADRLRDFRRALARANTGPFQWVVTNIDQFSSDTFRTRGAWTPTKAFQDFLDIVEGSGKRGVLIFDESSKAKNPTSRRTQALHRIAALCARRMILTGTPVTKSPLDVWAQFEVLKRGALGIYSYLGFERHYGVQQRVRFGNRTVIQTVAYRNLEELEERVAHLSFRALARDCLDLPRLVRRMIPVELTPEQEETCKQLRTEMLAGLEGGALVDGRNILTRFLRMAQVLGGFVGTMDESGQPTGEQHAYSPNPKLDALVEYLDLAFEDPTSKAVVFAQFRAEIAAITAAARKHGWSPVVFHGGISEEERDAGRRRFQEDPACRVFVAQYQTGSYGLNLVAANHSIFYGLTFDLELFAQARKRVHRQGQERMVNEVILRATTADGRRTMDHVILEALDGKQSFADVVTGDRKALTATLETM